MSRFQVSKVIFALVILICIQAYNANRKDVSIKENKQSISREQLSNALAMHHGTNSKSKQSKEKLSAKHKKQKLQTKHNKKKTFKRKDKNERKRKGKNKRKGKASKKQRKIRKITKLKKKQMLSNKAARSSRNAPIVGDVCEFVDFFGARRMGTGCEDGSKVVITQKSGVRKQFLVAGGRTIFGFVSKEGGKFRNCTCATERTSSAQCKALVGLSDVSLADSSKSTRKAGGRAILKASPCQWIDLEKVREEGSGCVDGSKFVVSKERGVRRQYLFVDGRTVLAFVTNGEKFAECANYTDITADVKCKVMEGVENVELASECSSTATTTQEGESSPCFAFRVTVHKSSRR